MIRMQHLKVAFASILVFLVVLSLLSGCQERPNEPDKLIIYHYNAIIRIALDKEKDANTRKAEILKYWDSVKSEVQFAADQLQQTVGNSNNIETDHILEHVFDKLRELSTVLSDEEIDLDMRNSALSSGNG